MLTRFASTCSVLSVIAISLLPGCGGNSSNTTVTAPTITSFTPSSGPVNTVVTVTGTGFLTTSAVSVGGVVTNPGTILSDTQLAFLVPPTTVTGLISVTNPGGTANSTTAYTMAPSFVSAGSGLTPIYPVSGPVGTTVTLNGYGFAAGATTVTFGSSGPAQANVESVNTLTVLVPTDATSGAVIITVSGLQGAGPTFEVTQ